MAAVEFALVAPILFFLVLGMVEFGLALSQYIDLTEGVRVGSRQLALSRTDPTPYTDTLNTVKNASPNLKSLNLTIYTCVNSTTCTAASSTRCNSDASCVTALNHSSGEPATVTATYACSLVVMRHDFLPNCTLSSTTTAMIE